MSISIWSYFKLVLKTKHKYEQTKIFNESSLCSGKDCGSYNVPNATCDAKYGNTIFENKFEDEKNCICDEGFELKSGNLSRLCTAAGEWDGDVPVCNSMPVQTHLNNFFV